MKASKKGASVDILAIGNQKGGVGKTTLTVLLADALTRAGRSVLLVDLDPQANATRACGADAAVGITLGDVLLAPKRLPLVQAVRPGALGFDVAVSSTDLAAKERNRTTADEHHLAALLLHVIDYDVVLVDCPPSLGVLTVNALTAATAYLTVTDGSRFALDGTIGLAETADVVRTYFNPDLTHAGVAINLVDHTLESQRRVAELFEHWGAAILPPPLHRRVVVKEAIAASCSLWTYGADRDADQLCRAIEQLADQVVSIHAR
jgi:chromosome partitioning protein